MFTAPDFVRDRLRNILFDAHLINGRPLFENAAALVKALEAQDPKKYSKSSTSSFLSQVLSGRKSLPTHLLASIRRLARKGAGGKQKEVDEILRRAGAQHNEETKRLRSARKKNLGTSPFELFNELLYQTCIAQEQHIITARTQEELRKPSPKGQLLNDILIYRLHLFDGPPKNIAELDLPVALGSDFGASIRYHFYLPNKSTARAFWHNLYKRITASNPIGRNLTERAASQRLDALSQIDSLATNTRALEVLAIESDIGLSAVCAIPVVAFDLELPGKGCAFSFTFDAARRPQVIKWDPETLGLWLNYFYRNRSRLNFERYPWGQAQADSLNPLKT